jgi:hypothetical protein
VSTSTIPIPASHSPVEPRKPRRSVKAPGIKAEVIRRRINNDSKRNIAKELGITRNTVTTILEEGHVEQALSTGIQLTAGLIPKAIGVISKRLDMNSENAAVKLLEATIWPLDRKNSNRGLGHDTLLQVAITNLIQPTTSNGGSAQSAQAETTPNPQVVDITPVSKS